MRECMWIRGQSFCRFDSFGVGEGCSCVTDGVSLAFTSCIARKSVQGS